MKINLSADKRTASVGTSVLTAGQTIGFKPTDDFKVGVGKVVEFKMVDGWSLWMYVQDIIDNLFHWVPCRCWKEQQDAGMFEDIKIGEPQKPQTKYASNAKLNTGYEDEDLDTSGPDLW